MRTTPVVLVTGVAPEAMAAATIALQWDLPDAVVVQHRIDVGRSVLMRTVSDVSGVVEDERIDLEHACVSCAIREDIVPTLVRLAAAERWGAVVAQLPPGAEAQQVCRVAARDPRLRQVRIAGVVCAADGDRLADDLLGDELLCERGVHTAADDRRGVAEVGAAEVEYADAVAIAGTAEAAELELIRTLARPGALVSGSPGPTGGGASARARDGAGGDGAGGGLDARRLLAGIHDHAAAEAWVAQVRPGPLPAHVSGQVWRLDLRSDRPFHPDRLYAGIAGLGSGPRRSRGCFWLPTRSGVACAWDGAGGQLSIGVAEPWGPRRPFTRIVVTGMDDGRDDLAAAFRRCLLDDAELRRRGAYWEAAGDGFEAWLGDIHSPL
ncbi:CobW family GTP-binding protein [Jiangella alba]|uniref:GTPase, G3E family n=1 Tax=Jiangella alba TaxID=561176 RepID=A0A1H5KSH0_9ACTN|nr:GTP-binding protein [Jiangella alba]SEE67337.1 GTPase, G3E family [Jiangella alba]